MPGWTPVPRGHVLAVDQATQVASVIPIPARDLAAAP
jgi:hypothetical protein